MACRTAREKRELLRVVRTPDGHVSLDVSGRLNGRGAYVCRDEACVTTATDRGPLARALEAPIPASLRAEMLALATEHVMTGGHLGQE